MSEYQYYEFQAVDKSLNEQDMKELRKLSTRAQITPTSFINVYNWGDFRGDPLALVEKYFDAFLYLANWGTHWFMLRIPNRLLDTETASRYCLGKSAKLHVKGKNLILEFHSEDEDRNWVDGEGLLSSLITLRSDLLHGDQRCLYLAWLFCAQMGELDDSDVEPSIPPNLGNLNAALRNFSKFLRIDTDLIAVAAENSPSEDRTQAHQQKEMISWINGLTDSEKNGILLRLINDSDPLLGAELRQRFQQTLPSEDAMNKECKPRTVTELLVAAKIRAEKRKRLVADQKTKEKARRDREKAIAREKYLADLATRESEVWEEVDTLIETKRQSDYDKSVKLLVDLRDVGRKKGRVDRFEERLQDLCRQHRRKSSFMRRIKKAGLGDGKA